MRNDITDESFHNASEIPMRVNEDLNKTTSSYLTLKVQHKPIADLADKNLDTPKRLKAARLPKVRIELTPDGGKNIT